MSEQQRAAVERACADAARAYETADGLDFPGLALIASGRR